MYNVGETFIRMFIMSLTEFAVLFEQLELCDLNLIGRVNNFLLIKKNVLIYR